MVVIVLTGGIGSGKSVAAEYFSGRGARVIDLDEVAHEVMVRDSEVLGAVAAEFGEEILLADGSLDRAALARAGFASPAATERLNALIHPAVAREAAEELRVLAQRRPAPRAVVIEVPLLAEAPYFADLADIVLAIAAPEPLRIDRAASRGLERADVERRVRVQAPDAARAALADVVIENDGTLEQYLEALGRFVDQHLGESVLDG